VAEKVPDDAITISCGEGYGGSPFLTGQVLRNPRNKEQILFVITPKQRYFREDGMSFGVGDESGYIYSAQCRLATDDEAAPILQREAAPILQRESEKAAKQTAEARRTSIAEQIIAANLTPDKLITLNGEKIMDRQTIYGGGDWFVIESSAIWYVRNNGADGDNWSNNNIQTGGAGAVGYMVLFDQVLADELRALEAQLMPEAVEEKQAGAQAIKAAPQLPAWTQQDRPARIYSSKRTGYPTLFINTVHARNYSPGYVADMNVVEYDRTVLHAYDHADLSWQLWDDGKITRRFKIKLPIEHNPLRHLDLDMPSIYPADISMLIGAGLQTRTITPEYKAWLLSMQSVRSGEVEYRNVITLLSINAEGGREYLDDTIAVPADEDPIKVIFTRSGRNFDVKVTRFHVRFADSHNEYVYYSTCDWGYMGADGDAGMHYHLTAERSEAIDNARQWAKKWA
jgi:hypothetical protein